MCVCGCEGKLWQQLLAGTVRTKRAYNELTVKLNSSESKSNSNAQHTQHAARISHNNKNNNKRNNKSSNNVQQNSIKIRRNESNWFTSNYTIYLLCSDAGIAAAASATASASACASVTATAAADTNKYDADGAADADAKHLKH